MRRRAWNTGLALVVVFGLASPAFATGPCTCDDIGNVERALENAVKSLELWRQVKGEAAKKLFPTGDWANARFLQLWREAFPTKTPMVLGQQNYGEDEIYVSEALNKECAGIKEAGLAHERDHLRHDKTISDQWAVLVALAGQQGRDLTVKEIAGHMVWVEMLSKELERLGRECGPEEESEPEPVTSIERYEAHMRAERDRQKVMVAAAAARVTAYAKALR
jgi:hypothetical protein